LIPRCPHSDARRPKRTTAAEDVLRTHGPADSGRRHNSRTQMTAGANSCKITRKMPAVIEPELNFMTSQDRSLQRPSGITNHAAASRGSRGDQTATGRCKHPLSISTTGCERMEGMPARRVLLAHVQPGVLLTVPRVHQRRVQRALPAERFLVRNDVGHAGRTWVLQGLRRSPCHPAKGSLRGRRGVLL
jgi:hypothetical protein